jgi:hypothetical protein
MLQRETLNRVEDSTKPKPAAEKAAGRSQSENAKLKTEEDVPKEQEELQYFSFKKKMQIALHKRQQI